MKSHKMNFDNDTNLWIQKLREFTVHQTNKLPIAQMPHPHYQKSNKGDPEHNNFLMKFLTPTDSTTHKKKSNTGWDFGTSRHRACSDAPGAMMVCGSAKSFASQQHMEGRNESYVRSGYIWKNICTLTGTFQRWCRHQFHPSPVKVWPH